MAHCVSSVTQSHRHTRDRDAARLQIFDSQETHVRAGTQHLAPPIRRFVSQYMHVLRDQMILRILTRRHEDSVQSAALGRPEALVAYAQVGDDTWATRGRQAVGQIGRGMSGL